ncbi:hypothetical protein ICM_04975 [Bacillus cereus BAG1X2-3]|uniref:Uncharacterized protein n=1 Tax=Bacillus cereus TaxID=1396 RepID=A0A9X7HK50_BACCE|nr:hypothetical protein [Bacillus cereus]EOO24522.1 hypothetical protein ICC_05244 [Bacillus cereus BAG1X1-1]EOO43203.1 hypothetical protein ICI_05971 [Bacillus cereus BAG1X2-1]EOO45451.1 hypothetical protein ICK_05796 [Bacillus cereus BAG1X2-2]EOO62250.1 hypothetical protein ICM_04975 [Bacillus cereus BAG1X2-3]EOP01214.1 hypothetical protein ICO_05641 [Bacillus cereus BAG2O-1]
MHPNKYNTLALLCMMLFFITWILIFSYGDYNYSANDAGSNFTPAEMRISIVLDILQMTFLLMSFVFGLIAYYVSEDNGGYAGIYILASLVLFILTGFYDVVIVYILVTEPIHWKPFFM